jgi:hypothetical protein
LAPPPPASIATTARLLGTGRCSNEPSDALAETLFASFQQTGSAFVAALQVPSSGYCLWIDDQLMDLDWEIDKLMNLIGARRVLPESQVSEGTPFSEAASLLIHLFLIRLSNGIQNSNVANSINLRASDTSATSTCGSLFFLVRQSAQLYAAADIVHSRLSFSG